MFIAGVVILCEKILLRCELHELGEYEECVIIEFINQVDAPRFFSRWTLENARRD